MEPRNPDQTPPLEGDIPAHTVPSLRFGWILGKVLTPSGQPDHWGRHSQERGEGAEPAGELGGSLLAHVLSQNGVDATYPGRVPRGLHASPL